MKDVIDSKVELVKGKEPLPRLEGWASADRLAMWSAIEERDCARNKLAKTSVKLQATKRALNGTFDHFKQHSSNVQAAEAAVQERMKPKLCNYM